MRCLYSFETLVWCSVTTTITTAAHTTKVSPTMQYSFAVYDNGMTAASFKSDCFGNVPVSNSIWSLCAWRSASFRIFDSFFIPSAVSKDIFRKLSSPCINWRFSLFNAPYHTSLFMCPVWSNPNIFIITFCWTLPSFARSKRTLECSAID